MKIISNQAIPVVDWNAFLAGNHFASPFQSYNFYRVFNSVEGLAAEAHAACDNGRMLALAVITIQKSPGASSFFSRRAIIYGGPLIEPSYPEAIDYLLEHISLALKGKVIYAETRNLSDYSMFREVFHKYGWDYVPYLNFIIRTDDFGEMVKSVSASRLRNIKRAKASGVTWKKAETLEEVKELYSILRVLYSSKIRKPLLPWDFFRLFFEENVGVFLLVMFKSKIIGGIVCPLMSGKALYEFYVCGLDNEFRDQNPSIMATWAALEYASENGIPAFDFMGGGKPDEEYGVRDFKARFGGRRVEYGRFRRILNPFLYRIGEFVIKSRTSKDR
ncbi:MAG: peptidoglycan bridge formation glycyltransferase FemA/FemB family protein [Bacteroidales bacterium]